MFDTRAPMPRGTKPRLTPPQIRALTWLSKRHTARRAQGTVVVIDGQRLCTVSTMEALEKHGFVLQRAPGEWVAAPTAPPDPYRWKLLNQPSLEPR